MHITAELLDRLKAYKTDNKISFAALSRRIAMTPQSLSRMLSGQTKSVNDNSGAMIRSILQLDDTPLVVRGENRPLIRIHYNGTAMNPVLEKGTVVMAESVDPTALKNGDIVVASIRDDAGDFRRTCRYFRKINNRVQFYPERASSETHDCSFSRIDWCAKVIFPAREIRIKD